MASSNRKEDVAELTEVALGRDLPMSQLANLIGLDDLRHSGDLREVLWVGSIGYERYRDVTSFIESLHEASVERLIDVRELPTSRRRGYAKKALGAALSEWGIEYLHLRALGNPKPLRDLYKSGRVAEGRDGYAQLLVDERMGYLCEVPALLREKRSALMCVEHDEDVCHRQVILSALQSHLGVQLEVCRLG